jgi:hypothetical protein
MLIPRTAVAFVKQNMTLSKTVAVFVLSLFSMRFLTQFGDFLEQRFRPA